MCEILKDSIGFDKKNLGKYEEYIIFDENKKNIFILIKNGNIIEMNLSLGTYELNGVSKSFSFSQISFDLILDDIGGLKKLDKIILPKHLESIFGDYLKKSRKYEIKQHKKFVKNSLYDLIDN